MLAIGNVLQQDKYAATRYMAIQCQFGQKVSKIDLAYSKLQQKFQRICVRETTNYKFNSLLNRWN